MLTAGIELVADYQTAAFGKPFARSCSFSMCTSCSEVASDAILPAPEPAPGTILSFPAKTQHLVVILIPPQQTIVTKLPTKIVTFIIDLSIFVPAGLTYVNICNCFLWKNYAGIGTRAPSVRAC
jgi:hypothetical protein